MNIFSFVFSFNVSCKSRLGLVHRFSIAAAQLSFKLFALKLGQCGRKNLNRIELALNYSSINQYKKSLRIRTLVIVWVQKLVGLSWQFYNFRGVLFSNDTAISVYRTEKIF